MSRKLEPFEPLVPGKARVYVCGPTTYNVAHAGHARANMAFDILVRHLRARGFEVTFVRNVTDVDDKILAAAKVSGEEPLALSARMAKLVDDDMRALGLLSPDVEPRVSAHIDDIVRLIETLLAKGHAYAVDTAKGKDVYFAVRSAPAYGKLSHRNIDDLLSGARVDVGESKKDPLDFALWKGSEEAWGWPSPWGKGRPGWHIECSAMASKYLGPHFDIHGGGEDLIFPHHENEIAQSEAATGHVFVKLWLHAEHLIIDGQKMSKSLGNFFTLRDLFARGQKPSTIRFLLLSVPYRRQLNFTEDGLKQAQNSIERLRNFVARLKIAKFGPGSNPEIVKRVERAEDDFTAGLADDVNTAMALAAVFDLVRDVNTAMDRTTFLQQDAPRVLAAMEKFDQILAVLNDDDGEKLRKLGLGAEAPRMGADQIEALVAERLAAKKRRDFQRSDEIRQQLADFGIVIEDTKDGSIRWKYK
jgi:cysteinyl-tRNA synthetase